MSWDVTTTPPVGQATKRSEYTRLRDSLKSVRQQSWSFGGSLLAFETVAAADTYVDLPDSAEIEINGDDLSGLSAFLEVNAIGMDATAVTITCQLYNVTAAAAVASSAVTVVNPGTTRTRGVSSTITLAAGNNRYKVQIKRSVTTAGVAARARVYTR
jgi:hypothetical protein